MRMSLVNWLIDWVHLVCLASFLATLTVTQYFILGFYCIFPFPSLLDKLFWTSRCLQRLFSFRLGGVDSEKDFITRSTVDDLVATTEFKLETHCAQTTDGFTLVLHRLVPRDANKDKDKQRLPVLVMHALLQDSESLLCDQQNSLGFYLARAGYDVWLGNNRGNRYSNKHNRFTPHDEQYWNFSIDELARYDVPAMISYVLSYTGYDQLRYVGMSQGSAQAFAAFVLDPSLAQKVKVFVALAAPPRAKGLSRSFLSSLVESNPRFIYLIFGRHAMINSTFLWMRIFSRQMFVTAVDIAMHYLFHWNTRETSNARKLVLYQHIFSYASVKTVVHWFQLIKLRKLAMYQDTNSFNRLPVVYDLTRLTVPTAVFYGGKDTVIDVDALVKELPNLVRLYKEENFEHLDMVWADKAVKNIFPQVVEVMRAQEGKQLGNSNRAESS